MSWMYLWWGDGRMSLTLLEFYYMEATGKYIPDKKLREQLKEVENL